MGILLFQFLNHKKDDFEYSLLYLQLPIERIRFLQGHLQGIVDVLSLCDTLDKYRPMTIEEKIQIAQKRNPREPSQAEVMGGLQNLTKRSVE